MPDDFDDEELDDEVDDQTPSPVRAQQRELQKKNKQLQRELDQAKAAQRENAFLKAGIDPSDPKAKYFVLGYDGPLEVDAIKAEAVEAGILTSTADPAIAEAQRAANVSVGAGGAPAGSGSVPAWHPNSPTFGEYQSELAAATSMDAVKAVMDKYDSPRMSEVI